MSVMPLAAVKQLFFRRIREDGSKPRGEVTVIIYQRPGQLRVDLEPVAESLRQVFRIFHLAPSFDGCGNSGNGSRSNAKKMIGRNTANPFLTCGSVVSRADSPPHVGRSLHSIKL